MKGKDKAITLCILYLTLALADGALTWVGTPDLSLEGNPLVAVLGLGWGALFTANALVFMLYVLVCRYAFVLYQPPVIPCEGGVKPYVSQLLYGRPDKFHWIFYKLRCNWRPVLACFGCGFSITAIVARAVLVLEWLFHIFGVSIPFYRRLRGTVPGGRMDIALSIIVMAALMVRWFRVEYKRNLAAVEAMA